MNKLSISTTEHQPTASLPVYSLATRPPARHDSIVASPPACPPATHQGIAAARPPARLRRRVCRPPRQRGIALITVLLVMTSVMLLSLAMQELVESNIRLSGAQYQVRVARSSSTMVMNVFNQLGRPTLAQLVPANFMNTENLDLSGNADLNRDINVALADIATGTNGLIAAQAFAFVPGANNIVRADYIGRSLVPPGNEAAELFPVTINNGQFCADFFRLVATAATTGGARGAVDQNMYIVSPCGNN